MKYYADLHIHSALSACAENDMTPNNIVNMSLLKGLQIISVTDHNSAANLPAVESVCRRAGLILIPGIELTTSEEVHLLCYFRKLEHALDFSLYIYSNMPSYSNRKDIFGDQLVMDDNDEIVHEESLLLSTASFIDFDGAVKKVKDMGGCAVPAHVDRSSYSVLTNLGDIPDYLNIKMVEISRNCYIEDFIKTRKNMGKYSYFISSDAHRLGDILERQMFFDLNELSCEKLIEYLL